MNILRRAATTLLLTGAVVLGVGLLAVPEAAASGIDEAIKGANSVQTSEVTSAKTAIQTVTNILLFIVGVIAVIMIVIGGLKYTASNGDSNQITAAKNTIMYAVIGLIVAILAYALVQFIINAFVEPKPEASLLFSHFLV